MIYYGRHFIPRKPPSPARARARHRQIERLRHLINELPGDTDAERELRANVTNELATIGADFFFGKADIFA